MPLTKNILRTRYRILPGNFPITLTPKNPTAAEIGPIQGCNRTNWSQAEISQFGGAGIESDRISFLIPSLTLELVTTSKPIRGWWITDADGTWTIKGVNWELMDATYRCACIKNVG